MSNLTVSADEKKALSVLAFLLFRMGQGERAARVYESLVELSEPGSSDWLFAQEGLAAARIELGDGEKALAAVKAAMKGRVLSSRESALHLLKAQALWLLGRKEEARASRDTYLALTGSHSEK